MASAFLLITKVTAINPVNEKPQNVTYPTLYQSRFSQIIQITLLCRSQGKMSA